MAFLKKSDYRTKEAVIWNSFVKFGKKLMRRIQRNWSLKMYQF